MQVCLGDCAFAALKNPRSNIYQTTRVHVALAHVFRGEGKRGRHTDIGSQKLLKLGLASLELAQDVLAHHHLTSTQGS